jgi:hypothetical protein
MKKIVIILSLFLAPSLPIKAKRPRKEKPHRVENTKIVLSNLAKMIGQLGNIIENPRDTENVSDSVSNIVDNIIKITVNSVQQRKIRLNRAHAVIQELQRLCKNDEILINKIVTTRKNLSK